MKNLTLKLTLIISIFSLTILFLSDSGKINAQQLAFPGAEGFGAYATGGRGGTVVHVTNLNNYGPGSFADAVSQPNRIVVFDVGGVIQNDGIIMVSSNITIAGQTAPGGGITIYGNRLVSNGTNVIVRFLRIRGSIRMSSGSCSLTCDGATNIIYDHCSISWGRWDNVHIANSSDVTFQYCIIGEGIDPQRFGAITDGTWNWTVSHCLWINNTSRNPKMKCNLQYINNVIYNYGNGIVGGHSAADHYQDVVNNYFIAGPSASGGNYLSDWTATDHFYSSGNYVDINKDGVLNGTLMTDYNGATVMTTTNANNISPVPVTVESAANAYNTVLNDAGASLVRDTVDERLLSQLASLGTSGLIIHSDAEVNGPGRVANGIPPLDTDRDGMPDSWELSKGLNPNSAADANGDYNGDGYTNIEKYINELGNTANVFRTPNLNGVAISKTEIDLTWTEASKVHTGFILEKSLNNVDWVQLADLAATVGTYKDLGLTQNTLYQYRIKAYNATEASGYSQIAIKTQSDTPINPFPTDNLSNIDSARVVFTWDASSEVISYDYYIGTDPASLVKTATGLTVKTLTANNLMGATTYYWRVDAITPSGTYPSKVWTFSTKKVFPQGMVAWYKLDEKSDVQVADSSIYRNDGYLIDMDSTVWQKGLFNGCVNSLGTDPTSHIEIPHSDPLFVDKGILGISFWLKCASQNAILFEKLGADESGVPKGYTVELTTTTMKLTLTSNGTSVVSTATLPLDFFNRWNSIVICRDTAIKRMRIYVNTVLLGNVTTSSNLDVGNNSSIFIGNSSDLTKPYHGQLDDVRFYNLGFYSNNMVNTIYNAYPAPDQAKNIFPLKNDICTNIQDLQLTWQAGPNSFSPTYDVYLGTDPVNLPLILPNLITSKNIVVPGILSQNTQYYWRIDSKNSKGSAPGEVWSFKTKKIIPNGLVGNWKLDEITGLIAADSSIYRNNGFVRKLTGDPIHEVGHLGNSFNFSNGRDSTHIFIPAANQLYFDKNSFTISLWMKIAVAPVASSYLINKGSFLNDPNRGTNGKWYGLELKGANFTFAVDDDITKSALTTSSAPFCTGQCVHVVAVRDSVAKKIIIYRNGVLLSSLADVTGSIGNPESLIIANVRDLNAPYFGSVDEIKIYNYALTPAEVANLHKSNELTNLFKINQLNDKITIYPNPVVDKLYVKIDKVSEKNTVTIESISGVKMLESKIFSTSSIIIDLSFLPKGPYIVKTTIDSQTNSKLIIKK